MLDPWKEMEAGIRASGLRSGWLTGRASGCPFCLARGRELPLVGDRVRVLFELSQYSRGLVGRTGTVIEGPLVELDDDPSTFYPMDIGQGRFYLTNMDRDRVLMETLPQGPLPSWVPPIRLKEAGQLDMIAMRMCNEDHPGSHATPDLSLLYQLIQYIWHQRLDLTADEVWAVLEAHGAPLDWRSEVMSRYQYGHEALVRVVGKRPFKNRRVAPLSI